MAIKVEVYRQRRERAFLTEGQFTLMWIRINLLSLKSHFSDAHRREGIFSLELLSYGF